MLVMTLIWEIFLILLSFMWQIKKEYFLFFHCINFGFQLRQSHLTLISKALCYCSHLKYIIFNNSYHTLTCLNLSVTLPTTNNIRSMLSNWNVARVHVHPPHVHTFTCKIKRKSINVRQTSHIIPPPSTVNEWQLSCCMCEWVNAPGCHLMLRGGLHL